MDVRRIDSKDKQGIIVMGTGARRLNLDLMKEQIKIMKQDEEAVTDRKGYLHHNLPSVYKRK
ncbi:hypothetical protein [Bacillus toyonensis]|uniref:hypothetical protein n=1 Tax=Bacillus toyonensis TaxID=155322 RepID=UPI000BF3ADE3|nr:hypothetical protein [Bacillus toyonensis]PGF05141.1 hypothetical protein COM61_01580 [Bacillus toyonensis]